MLGAPEDLSHAAELEPLEPGDYFTRSQEDTDDEDDAAAKASEQASNSGEAHSPAPGVVRRAAWYEANYTKSGGGDPCLRPNFLHMPAGDSKAMPDPRHTIRGASPKIQLAPSSNASIPSNFWTAVTESLQKENMQPRSEAATNTLSTNTLSTHEKELMMAKAGNEKKKEMRFDQKLRRSKQREAEKGKRRKCDLISSTMRSDAAQLLTEDNKAALRERIMSIIMHDD
eukprot:jgi/Tetstr1/431036/TSEL_020755.t1